MANIGKFYLAWAKTLDGLKHLFLLLIRIYFGWGFFLSGTKKLSDIAGTTAWFESMHIPQPMVNAYMAGSTETVCGVLLILGLASRIITIPLIGTMIVAFATAHQDALPWYKIEPWWHVEEWKPIAGIFSAGAFPYLYSCLLILLVGPGLFSVDAAIKTLFKVQPADPAVPPRLEPTSVARRAMIRLAAAVLGGLTTGAIVYHFFKKSEPVPENTVKNNDEDDGKEFECSGGPLPPLIENPAVHVCRGINTGKNDGKKGTTNTCAGRAHCATVSSHGCDGLNDCKGQGGCGEHPGENACKEKGKCQVPLKADTWAKARKRFEELMNAAHRKFGKAPDS
jgi:uncharacterized membrane protein YphA (DoxX/SURF4 family)